MHEPRHPVGVPGRRVELSEGSPRTRTAVLCVWDTAIHVRIALRLRFAHLLKSALCGSLLCYAPNGSCGSPNAALYADRWSVRERPSPKAGPVRSAGAGIRVPTPPDGPLNGKMVCWKGRRAAMHEPRHPLGVPGRRLELSEGSPRTRTAILGVWEPPFMYGSLRLRFDPVWAHDAKHPLCFARENVKSAWYVNGWPQRTAWAHNPPSRVDSCTKSHRSGTRRVVSLWQNGAIQ